MKKFFGEFKKFISRGNVLDMAVGVVVGSAFTAIVTAFTNGILKPFLDWLLSLCFGTDSFDGVLIYLKEAYEVNELGVTTDTIDVANSIYIDIGALITAIINFILIALVVFIIVKVVNRVKEATLDDDEMVKLVQGKLDKGQALTDVEKGWLERYTKKNPDKAPKAKKPGPTVTEALLAQIVELLKDKNGEEQKEEQKAEN